MATGVLGMATQAPTTSTPIHISNQQRYTRSLHPQTALKWSLKTTRVEIWKKNYFDGWTGYMDIWMISNPLIAELCNEMLQDTIHALAMEDISMTPRKLCKQPP